MRRKKEEVLTELPDLIEVVYKNELEDQQKAIYLAQLQQMRERLAQVTDQELRRQLLYFVPKTRNSREQSIFLYRKWRENRC